MDEMWIEEICKWCKHKAVNGGCPLTVCAYPHVREKYLDGLHSKKSIKGVSPDEPTKTTRRSVLEQAIQCVCTDREQQHGSPEDNFGFISRLWDLYINYRFENGGDITAHDVAVMMSLFKIGRIASGRFKKDSYVDGCGYLACAGEIALKEGSNEKK